MAGLFGDDPPNESPAPPFQSPSLLVDEQDGSQVAAYRVLARKYRPISFDELIGQEGLVRTLTNAFLMNRIAHAFMLTGVRGVGKTTTARILARALNCTGAESKDRPTAYPCGKCENCIAILGDRHPDVVEMDAASNTGVDDVREIIEATRYRPLSARYKVFIIDEVHMLSRNAFNALLKTLEEPPPHVKFIFATTEIRKVPVTVLSRCQRFDLRRVSVAELSGRFAAIARQENITIEDEAIAHIARAADGSVRDGLSLLDQAIARGAEGNAGITADLVAEMLGLADRAHIYQLMEAVSAGNIVEALAVLDIAHGQGVDVGVMLADLLDRAHFLTRLKISPALAQGSTLPELDRKAGSALAAKLSVPWLGRLWQMLLKGIAEVEQAPDRRAAAEMILIRLCHVAELPPPGELLKQLEGAIGKNPNVAIGAPAGGGIRAQASPAAQALQAAPAFAAAEPDAALAPAIARALHFNDVVALAGARHDVMLYAHLRQSVHLVRFAPPVIELRLEPQAPRDFAPRLAALLEAETSRRWTIALSQAEGGPTIDAVERAAEAAVLRNAEDHPLVRAILETFPGARIEPVNAPETSEAAPPDWAMFGAPEDAYDEVE